MKYKLQKDLLTNNITGIKRLSDNACIPLDESNTDYQEYIEWTKESPANVAAPADE